MYEIFSIIVFISNNLKNALSMHYQLHFAQA